MQALNLPHCYHKQLVNSQYYCGSPHERIPETEAVERALELVVFQEDALKAFQELCEKGEVEDVFGHYRRQNSQCRFER